MLNDYFFFSAHMLSVAALFLFGSTFHRVVRCLPLPQMRLLAVCAAISLRAHLQATSGCARASGRAILIACVCARVCVFVWQDDVGECASVQTRLETSVVASVPNHLGRECTRTEGRIWDSAANEWRGGEKEKTQLLRQTHIALTFAAGEQAAVFRHAILPNQRALSMARFASRMSRRTC